ncbi:YmiA family putative membrane protein [[Enterobacter] lignolyticus]|nr:YmiA family putative membrane protein [[Enterobacter] lignolyticus]
MRLAMPAEREESPRDPALKRKAWRAVFLGSAVFWGVVVFLIWTFWG